ncbi:MAG TPA: monofunctional biosynthetic peptidoglycan transglycosylase [Steroidobacteraceae bacterium]|jgi:monofunctional glycosyltransferase|nr:monofunctional biosynthetic peptidoglycan transglycosylase [Steroidobacteraceae bacterium]
MTAATFFRRVLRLFSWLLVLFVVLSIGSVIAFRWIDPPTSAFMVRERMIGPKAGAKAYAVRYRWVDWSNTSPHVKVAVIAAEDQNFPAHYGFDLKSINDALADRERGRRVRGASTISQQVAKNLFLWPSQTWLRKGLEAYFTVLIETLWPKQRILEVYLNIAEFGRGVFGVGAAADVFFHKPAARLSQYDAALLAAVLPSPKRMRVNAPSNYVRSRQQWILGQMRGLGGTALLKELSG